MNVFIDNNVLLSFFGSETNIPTLKEFLKLVDQKKVKFLVTEQLHNEYVRDVGDRKQQERDKCESWYKAINKIIGESGDEREKEKKILNAKKQILEKQKAIKNHIKIVDSLITKILSKGKKIKVSDELVKKAQIRFLKGNPPGKKSDTSHGDAISWEALLENCAAEDLVIISSDPDFSEQKKENRDINRFLKQEWYSYSKKKVKLLGTLAEFINSIEKNNPISEAIVKKEKEISFAGDSVEKILELWRKNLSLTNFTDNSASTLASNFGPSVIRPWQFGLTQQKLCPYCSHAILTLIAPIKYTCPNCGMNYDL